MIYFEVQTYNHLYFPFLSHQEWWFCINLFIHLLTLNLNNLFSKMINSKHHICLFSSLLFFIIALAPLSNFISYVLIYNQIRLVFEVYGTIVEVVLLWDKATGARQGIYIELSTVTSFVYVTICYCNLACHGFRGVMSFTWCSHEHML